MRVRDIKAVVGEEEVKMGSWEGLWWNGAWCVCSSGIGRLINAVSWRLLC